MWEDSNGPRCSSRYNDTSATRYCRPGHLRLPSGARPSLCAPRTMRYTARAKVCPGMWVVLGRAQQFSPPPSNVHGMARHSGCPPLTSLSLPQGPALRRQPHVARAASVWTQLSHWRRPSCHAVVCERVLALQSHRVCSRCTMAPSQRVDYNTTPAFVTHATDGLPGLTTMRRRAAPSSGISAATCDASAGRAPCL